ncbi:hypothetical protein TPHA_0N00800 [Tetrapisispora phaffii CBS 4417]|uniref:Uncharacterized protein n=1 Tax=Tetrapisispora phaffii (strain ATCC 24235 / CBS 4417 / NBRC 1672 / NRRL Y-8282 / UCD 70-5) TaxID=1071381 RepID=G8C133_TETPH|nr:hypothetical protein TPHA_0N00800 [Tetrapisispora phaffii CBS 4417]CCE65861.1 hypothetical protein TPHA_0N00800 [Tetrapisispora phaffii CBS 4417]
MKNIMMNSEYGKKSPNNNNLYYSSNNFEKWNGTHESKFVKDMMISKSDKIPTLLRSDHTITYKNTIRFIDKEDKPEMKHLNTKHSAQKSAKSYKFKYSNNYENEHVNKNNKTPIMELDGIQSIDLNLNLTSNYDKLQKKLKKHHSNNKISTQPNDIFITNQFSIAKKHIFNNSNIYDYKSVNTAPHFSSNSKSIKVSHARSLDEINQNITFHGTNIPFKNDNLRNQLGDQFLFKTKNMNIDMLKIYSTVNEKETFNEESLTKENVATDKDNSNTNQADRLIMNVFRSETPAIKTKIRHSEKK